MNNKSIMMISTTILLIICIGNIANVSALGIAPSKKIIEYSIEEQIISSRVINNDGKDMTIRLSASGELSEYITFQDQAVDVRSYDPEKEFIYVVKLPSEVAPGTKTISITATEASSNNDNSIGGILSVTQQLIIQIPYAGKYVEGFMLISADTQDTPVTATINMINRGTEDTGPIQGDLVVKDYQDNEVYTERISSEAIAPGGMRKIENIFELEKPGSYIAEYHIRYDNKNLDLSQGFNIGTYTLILGGTSVKNFRLGTVAKFDITVSTNWNKPIDNIYGEVTIKDENDDIVGQTNITDVSIDPDNDVLVAYWDTSDIQAGEYMVSVKLFAGEEVITKEYQSKISEDKIMMDSETGTMTKETNTYGWMYVLVILIVLVIAVKMFAHTKRKNKKLYK